MFVPKVGASQWLEQIKQTQMQGDEQGMPSVHPYIFTVPEPLRTERPEAYLPHVVSLGPYHHLKLELYESERYKSRLTVQLKKRANQGRFESLVTDIISSAREIRNCYNENIACDDEVLGWMIARDAVFILKFLGCFDRCQTPRVQQANPHFESLDAVFDSEKKSPLFLPLQADIFKLENQVPLSILKKVLTWETGCESHDRLRRGIKEACAKFSPFLHVGGSYRSIIANDNLLDERHILECLYNAVVPPQPWRNLSSRGETVVPVQGHRVDHEETVQCFSIFSFLRKVRSRFRVPILPRPKHKANGNLPSASELQRKGVKFEPFTWGTAQISFDRASSTLFLPCIEMDYRTDVFLRNLVALEAFMKCNTRVVTCYVDLMDRLVDTSHDVAVLKKYGVMYSNLGSDKEVSILWNGISRSIWRSAYDQTIRDVNSYYKSKYRVMLGEFMHERFSKPWRAASVVGACILLLLAVIQTIFSYCQIRHKHKLL